MKFWGLEQLMLLRPEVMGLGVSWETCEGTYLVSVPVQIKNKTINNSETNKSPPISTQKQIPSIVKKC